MPRYLPNTNLSENIPNNFHSQSYHWWFAPIYCSLFYNNLSIYHLERLGVGRVYSSTCLAKSLYIFSTFWMRARTSCSLL